MGRGFSRTSPRRFYPASCILQTPCAGFSEHEPGIPPVSRLSIQCWVSGTGFQVPGPGTWNRIPGTGSTPKAGYRAPRAESGTGYQVSGAGYLGPGTRHLSRSDAEGRTASAEDRARLLENAHTGYARCRMRTPCAGFSKAGTWCQVPGSRYRVPATWHLVPGT